MDEIWLESPSPALRLGPAPGVWRVNSAAAAWAGRLSAGTADAVDWGQLAARLARVVPGALSGRIDVPALAWRRVMLPEGWLVWLMPESGTAPPPLPPAPWRSAADKLALMQDMLAIGIFERDLRTLEGRWDAQMFENFGLDPAESAPSFAAAAACVHPDDRERFLAEHERFVREGGRHRMGYRVQRADGSTRDILSLVDIAKDERGRPQTLIGLHVDDTIGAGRIREQRAVTDYLDRALDFAEVVVWRLDFRAWRAYFNGVGWRAIGIEAPPDGIPMEMMRGWVHPEDLPRVQRADERAAAGSAVVDLDARYRIGGKEPYVLLTTRRVAERDERGRVIGMFGITLNQSEQIAERERAAALARRIELIAEAADLGVWSVDGEGGHVEWNAQMCRIYGITAQQVPASVEEWRERWVHPEDRESLAAAAERANAQAASAFEVEFRIVRPDGSVRWVTSRSRREYRGRHVTLIGIHLDTTELMTQRRVAAQVLLEKETALRAVQARTEFLARASHELRTPLNAVIGFAQLLEHDDASASAALRLQRISHVRSAGEHLLTLVDDMLDLSAIESGKVQVAMEAVEIDALLAEVAQWSRASAQREGIAIEIARCGGTVRADARRLRQVLVNLVSNAIKFNRRGGTVWLSAQRHDEHHAALGHTVPRWHLSVRDDGRGLSVEEREHLFEAFHRLGPDRAGFFDVGLGLAIVAQLSALMGGRVEVSSAPGQGSEFRIVLAAADRVAPRGANTMPAAEPARAPAPALTMLYIEDNAVNVILVEGLVALRPGVALRCAVDGLSGVAMAIAQHPQLILIDMQLPDIDGLEVLRRLRAEPSLRGSRMIALSANTVSEDIAHALAEGFDDYWTKPIDFKLFLGRLDLMIEEARSIAP